MRTTTDTGFRLREPVPPRIFGTSCMCLATTETLPTGAEEFTVQPMAFLGRRCPEYQRKSRLEGGELLRPQGAALHPLDSSILYLNLRTHEFRGGVWKYDGAWTDLTSGWVNDTYATDWQISPEGIAISKSDPAKLISCNDVAVLLSDDGGASWRQASTKKVGDRWMGTGAELVYAYDIESGGGALYGAFEDIGLWRSDDQGQTWKQIWWYTDDTGQRVDPDNDAGGRVVVNPADPSRFYFTATSWSGGIRETANAKVFHSVDGGETVVEITPPSSADNAGRPAIDVVWGPTRQSDVVYVAFHGDTIYKSDDGGTGWTEISTGIPAEKKSLAFALKANPENPSEVYAGLSTWFGEYGASAGLYRSSDSGATWTQAAGFPETDVASIAFAGSPRRLFVSGWTYDGSISQGRLTVSDDGQVFTEVLSQPYVMDVTALPAAPSSLVAASSSMYQAGSGQDAGIYYSGDNGQTWSKLGGMLTHSRIFALHVMPEFPSRLLMATSGDGVVAAVMN